MDGGLRAGLDPRGTPFHLLPRKIHEEGHGQDDDEVKDHQFVHLLSDLGLPAL